MCADNIDYDDIKNFIKERTTPGKGKTIAVPGQPDDKAQGFENDLYLILEEQHSRIDLFVKSKAREIQHRLGEYNSFCGGEFTVLTAMPQTMRKSDCDSLRRVTRPSTIGYPSAG